MIRWAQLRQFGNSSVVRLTIVVPFVGYLVLLSQQLTDVLRMNEMISPVPSGYPWRLVLTYLGLTFLAIGTIIYSLRCPRIVRLYGSEVDYNTAEHSYWFTRGNRTDKIAQIARLHSIRSKRRTLPPEAKPMEARRGSSEAHAASDITIALANEWHLANTSSVLSALAVAVAFGLGTAILAVPTLLTFVDVVSSAVDALL